MVEYKNVFIQYVSEFYSLYDFSCAIKNHTLFIGDFFDGTTAIMRTLSKIDKNYKGEIYVDNVNLKNIKDKDLSIVYLPENPVFFKNKNIFKNLYCPLKIRKLSKNIAKNLINSIFLELKNNNFNFLNKDFNNKNNEENIKNDNDFINNILKIKLKKLNLSEQKIITLIRAVLRKPKYVLLENFFKNLDDQLISIALHLIEKLKTSSIIIACEKDETKLDYFKDFKINKLTSDNTEKKED